MEGSVYLSLCTYACKAMLKILFVPLDGHPFLPSFLSFFFLGGGVHPQHMKVSRLGVKSELQLLAYATATAMQDLSCICDLHHSSQKCRILNPLSKASDRTSILMDTRRILFCFATMGTPVTFFYSVLCAGWLTCKEDILRVVYKDDCLFLWFIEDGFIQ